MRGRPKCPGTPCEKPTDHESKSGPHQHEGGKRSDQSHNLTRQTKDFTGMQETCVCAPALPTRHLRHLCPLQKLSRETIDLKLGSLLLAFSLSFIAIVESEKNNLRAVSCKS